MSTWSAPWDLRGRGSKDALRHDVRVKDAIKKNLKEIIGEESIITSDGTQRIRIPLKYLEQYRFVYGNPQQGGIGQGEGRVGDVIWRPGQQGQQGQQSNQPGDQPGEHSYDVEIDLASVTQMMLEDLALPWLEAKPHARQLEGDTFEFTDLRKKGAWSTLDKRRSLKNNLLRNAVQHDPGVHDLSQDDLRFRTWDMHTEEIAQAVVYLMLDWSGSMTTDKKFLAKAVSFWIVQFLRVKYPRVDTVFIAHDTEAEIVSERDFFGRSEGGGTRCSSAYKVAYSHMEHHHPSALWNIYLLHFSDGDNEAQDNAVCKHLLESLLMLCQAVGYAEILWAQSASNTVSSLRQTLQTLKHPHFLTATLRTKDDIKQALQTFFGVDIGAQHGTT